MLYSSSGRNKFKEPELNGVDLASDSVLCSDHFTPECFEIDSLLAPSMGLEKRRKLKPDAVPSIFKTHSWRRNAGRM